MVLFRVELYKGYKNNILDSKRSTIVYVHEISILSRFLSFGGPKKLDFSLEHRPLHNISGVLKEKERLTT